ncbi:hypothetical protein BV22DRAFT_496468 [Leucogyrophana mollusca]|uniref:Uncharacterized protein n=1 Tax=Leucogyrophana mollusca TaxID=85980 RepID=A0ACB8BHD5_9AGAM|nr:hypothetical protein BV22DRAFT_496468 [Leucogyrophana mollusca]
MLSQSSSSATSSSSHLKLKKRRWTREQLLKSLEILGPLTAPLPPDLPPSPPSSRSNSPAPSPAKRKLDSIQEPDSAKRPRTTSQPDKSSSQHHHHHHYHHPPPPALHRVTNSAPAFNIRSEPSEDGELREDIAALPNRPPQAAVLATTVPVRRPRRGRPSHAVFDDIHDKYHQYGRKLKYSGDARFWSTYPASHKEYRPLANPPPPNSPYHKYGGLIARLELVDALVCFTYSIWSKDYSRKACFRETWTTIQAFLGWCKNKWMAEDTIGDREKALLGLIWMIEGFIHGRKFLYAAKGNIDPEMDRTWSKMKSEMAALSREAEKAEMSGNAGNANSLSLGSQATPPMLPSPASIAPAHSANSTPINNSSSGTPSTSSGSSLPPSVPPRPVYSGPMALPPHLLPQLPSGSDGLPASPNMVAAAAKATTTFGPAFTFSLKEQSGGIVAAAYCMDHSQRVLTLPVMQRHYPTTFARMMGTSLSVYEEHEPDIEDEEGELFWPGQCVTGEGLGWVCLMGKAMIKEIGRDIGYIGLSGVVPKPNASAAAGPSPAPTISDPQSQTSLR